MPTEKFTRTDYAIAAAETLKTIEQEEKQIKELEKKIKDNKNLHKKQIANAKATFYVNQNVARQPITGGKNKRRNKTANKKRSGRKTRSNRK
jgi:hypothetical protein